MRNDSCGYRDFFNKVNGWEEQQVICAHSYLGFRNIPFLPLQFVRATGCLSPCKMRTFQLGEVKGFAYRVDGEVYDFTLLISVPRAQTTVRKEYEV